MSIAQFISFPISVLLFIWMLRIKKDDPFPKGSVLKMVITGVLCVIGATIITLLLGLLALAIRLGPDTVKQMFSNPDPEVAAGISARIEALSGKPTLWRTFIQNFVFVAAIEEGLKYFAMRISSAKPGVIKNRMDALICAAIVGIAFQVVEDFTYASGLAIAVMRAVMPFHFLFGAIMGYYHGLFLETGNKSDHVKALLIPILIHGLFDFSIKCIEINDYYFIFTLVVMVLTFALAVYVIYKIHKWSKDGTLSKPIPALNSEEAGV